MFDEVFPVIHCQIYNFCNFLLNVTNQRSKIVKGFCLSIGHTEINFIFVVKKLGEIQNPSNKLVVFPQVQKKFLRFFKGEGILSEFSIEVLFFFDVRQYINVHTRKL